MDCKEQQVFTFNNPPSHIFTVVVRERWSSFIVPHSSILFFLIARCWLKMAYPFEAKQLFFPSFQFCRIILLNPTHAGHAALPYFYFVKETISLEFIMECHNVVISQYEGHSRDTQRGNPHNSAVPSTSFSAKQRPLSEEFLFRGRKRG